MKKETLTGIVLDDRTEITMAELCEACTSSTEWVIELVEEGVLEPIGPAPADWRFTGANLLRARTARRLEKDLRINLAGVALVLDLMAEIETLQARLRRLEDNW